jgi:hypothetical protein
MANDISIRRISKIAAEESIVPSKSGGKRLSSAVLTASSRDHDIYEGLSIDIEKVAHELGLDPKGFMNRGVFLSWRYFSQGQGLSGRTTHGWV